jgi:hypothetical protein
MAGMAAEHRFAGRRNWRGSGHDYEGSVDLASRLYFGRVLERFLGFMTERSKELIDRRIMWLKIEAVADALMEHRTLTGKRVREICRNAIQIAMEEAHRRRGVGVEEQPHGI